MEYKVVERDGVAYVTKVITVHQFTMGDVDDVEIYAAQPIYEWQQSPAGQWVMENAVEKPEWITQLDNHIMGHRIIIRARLTEKDITWFKLKYS